MAQPARSLHPQRSFTRHHDLLPASRPDTRNSSAYEPVPRLPAYSLISWTFGRGSVIWRIWPAVLLHTTFAAVIVTLSMKEIVHLDIPNVMLTVLGVVIGFVISYRASSGYDRYWLGRTCWSDVMRNARTMGRLIWFHVPLRLSPKTSQEMESGKIERSSEELLKVMAEKRVALDLLEGFAVALKHHLRGEVGIYYEDLYHLIRPLHEHEHTKDKAFEEATTSALSSPRRAQRISAFPPLPQAKSASASGSSSSRVPADVDPVIPPINTYGTFNPSKASLHHHLGRSKSRSSSLSSSSDSSRHVLLPSSLPEEDTVMAKVSSELIPFSGIASMVRRYFSTQRPLEVLPSNGTPMEQESNPHHHHWQGPIWTGTFDKNRPMVAGDGENLPLEVLRCLSEWLSVLEDRCTVPGTSMGPMIATIAAFEDSLTALERILTTPLPFVYSVHISTVWIYLFFLPFQLVTLFGYYTIPGVAIAAFIYLGFLAAGEEIEQPFGYDDNDLDLDLFCNEIIHADIVNLKTSPCLNAYFGPSRPVPVHRQSMTITEISSQYNIADESFGTSS